MCFCLGRFIQIPFEEKSRLLNHNYLNRAPSIACVTHTGSELQGGLPGEPWLKAVWFPGFTL